MFQRIKKVLKKNCFDMYIGEFYEDLPGITTNFYFTNSLKKIPSGKFIGLPSSTLRLLINKVRLLKENTYTEIRIFDGEYVFILYKKNDELSVYYQWKYRIIKINENFIKQENRLTKKKLFYKGNYLDFVKKVYEISIEFKNKFEEYGIRSDAEAELYQQIPVLEKYIKKLEKD